MRLACALAMLALALPACRGCQDPPILGHGDAAPPPASASASGAVTVPPARVLVDLASALPGCDIDHRGILLDLGTEAAIGRFGWKQGLPTGLEQLEHDGATWVRVFEKKLELTFVQLDTTPIFVSARAVGRGAKAVMITLDDQPLGTLNLARDLIKIASTGTTTLPVDPGLHTIALRFSGRPRTDSEGYVELDWVRIGVPDADPGTYGPPTLRDVVVPAAALGGVPHRALSLRPPADLRCALRVPQGARLRASVGLSGAGEGDAEVRVLRDGKKVDVLQQIHVTGGEKATWTDLDLPLSAYTSEVISLELGAVEGGRGTRVLFGDPAIVSPRVLPPPVPPARAVIVVILDGVERSELPPWNPAASASLPTLSELALVGAAFDHHRAPSTVIASSVASLLTGLAPRAHGLVDAAARLPAGAATLAGIARDASVRTAMFTGVPRTFRPFGFGEAWTRFAEHAPNGGDPATAPIDDAATWITEVIRDVPDAHLLAVVHARGGHPPWDVSAKELAGIPPLDYAGPIEPRRAAQVLARLRQRRQRNTNLAPADRDRVRALEAIALAGQDRALGSLVGALKTAGLWDSTLLVVTGDVASGASGPLPFAEAQPLDETTLSLPLYAHFPGGLFGGTRITAPTEMVDIARSAADALGLSVPKGARGRDLASVAGGLEDAVLEPMTATLGDAYAARWGNVVLAGRKDAPPTLCDLEPDPTCAFNRRETMPLAALALFRRFVANDAGSRAPAERREPATIDTETAAMLYVWGAD